MITRPAHRLALLSHAKPIPSITTSSPSHTSNRRSKARQFSTTPSLAAKNRMYTPVCRPSELQTYISNTTSTHTPLLTFWTASYCRTCSTVSPLLHELLQAGVGEEEGGVAFCEVEFDSMDIMDSDLGLTFAITSMPTLLAFQGGFAVQGTKGVDPGRMREREWLAEWIRGEARRRDGGGPGGGLVGGPMGGRFGFR